MKLKEWANLNSITYRTAWEHFRTGKIPNAYKLSTGTIVVKDIEKNLKCSHIVTYSRVSSSENKDNLIRQSERLTSYCNANGWKVDEAVIEVGSGLNDSRPKLLKILSEGRVTKLVVEHKDRLSRFGVKYIETLCKHIQCELIIINNVDNNRDDLMQDFVSIITSFCSRLYGLRRSKRRTEKLISELENENN
jgi:predicted site-specific integrase-resolvase